MRGRRGQKERTERSPWRKVTMFGESDKVATWRALWVSVAVLLVGVSARPVMYDTTDPDPGLADSAPLDSRAACALSLTQSHLADTTHITVLGHAPWLGGFLEVCHVPVTLLQLGVGRVRVLNQLYDVVFVVLDSDGNSSFVEEALVQIRRWHAYHTRVVIWWQTGDAQVAVDAARLLGMVHLVVVNGSAAAQRAFQYREDCEGGATVARAVLAGRCGQTSSQQAGEGLFPHHLRWNLRGCPLRLSSLNIPHFSTVQPGPEGRNILTGLFAIVAFYLAELVNGTLEVTTLEIRLPAENASAFSDEYLFQDLVYNRTDVLFGAFLRSKQGESLAYYTKSYVTSNAIFCVPSGLGTSPSPFSVLHREFPPDVWALLGLSVVAMLAALVLSWWGVVEYPVQDAAFFTMSALLGNSFVVHATTTRGTRVRVMTAFWMIFCIVLGTAYQAVRHSLFAAPHEDPQINSLAELAQSGLTLLGTPGDIRSLRRRVQEEDDPTFVKLLAQSEAVSVSHFEEAVARMATQRDAATFSDITPSMQYVARVELAKKRRLVHVVPGCCEASMVHSLLVLRKGSRYTSTADQAIDRLFDVGFNTFMKRQLTSRRPETMPHWSQFGLSKLIAPFLLMLIGLAASALVFGIENLVHRARREEANGGIEFQETP